LNAFFLLYFDSILTLLTAFDQSLFATFAFVRTPNCFLEPVFSCFFGYDTTQAFVDQKYYDVPAFHQMSNAV